MMAARIKLGPVGQHSEECLSGAFCIFTVIRQNYKTVNKYRNKNILNMIKEFIFYVSPSLSKNNNSEWAFLTHFFS